MRILIVEDDSVLLNVLSKFLNDLGHIVTCVSDISESKYILSIQAFDVVLLDLNLPINKESPSIIGSGLDILKLIRKNNDLTPVLVLTARDRTEERIYGLNAGADDYIGKPVDLFEVEARLRAILRRSQKTNEQQQIGKLRLDRTQKKIFVSDTELILPAREFEVLFELMTPPGKTVSKRDLALKLSNSEDYLIDNAIETFISRIRKKIISSNVNIRTLRGLGYLLEEKDHE
jgi:DNA-binding response OmpR family regulator